MPQTKTETMAEVAAWRREKYLAPELRYLFIEVTQRCNERCVHCGSRCGEGAAEEVPIGKLLEVLEEVAERTGGAKPMLCITGGEPLLRADLFELMSAATEMGFRWGMTTNGTLITPEVARCLAESGMRTVSVSLDGLPATNDRFRARAGAYDEALAGVRNLLEVDFEHVQVTTVVHKWNIRELEAMFDELDGVDIDSWRLTSIEPIGRALERPALMLDASDWRRLMSFVAEKRAQGWPVLFGCCHYLGEQWELEARDAYFLCNAGIYVESIMANGDIGSCLDIERRSETVMGNVYRDDLMDVWENGFGSLRRDRSEIDRRCAGCGEREFCAGGSWHSFDFDVRRQRMCMKDVLF